MDPEFVDLIPLFVEEARDRLERLAAALPRLSTDPQALVEAKRELHTVKGAGRMLQLGAVAELCHAAEETIADAPPDLSRRLTRAVDALSAMIETVARGEDPTPDPQVLAWLAGQAPEAQTDRASEAPSGTAPESARESAPDAATPEPAEAEASEDVSRRRAMEEDEADPVAEEGDGPFARPVPISAEPARPASAATPAGGSAGMLSGDVRVDTGALDAIAERATQVRIMALAAHPVVERIYDLARLAEDGLHEPQPTQVLAVLSTMLRRVAVELEGSQRRLVRSADEQLEKMLALQLQPIRGQLFSLARYARELARSLGREVEVEVQGEETRLDRRIVRELDDAFLHLVRNAVDHGIEPPEARAARGKLRTGRLRLAASAEGARVRLVIEDDGAGIEPRRVLEHAVRAGLVDEATSAGMGKAEALRLLFAPGFSTRKSVSEISGRGVGLDVVATAVNRLGGEIFLDSDPRRGTKVAIEVPVARRGEQMLLLKVGQIRLGLPAAVVKRAVRVTQGDVVERDGRTIARVDGRLVPFVPLARLYGQPAGERLMVLEGAVSGQELAVAVDDVLGEQEVLVRPLPKAAAADRLLEGLALLATGEPVGVLSPAVLSQREYLRSAPMARDVAPAQRMRVLLVDDSLVTREMERRLLEDAGFEVAAVGDADEALSRLGEERFGCVVTDIEMPGMDGFELTAHLRSMEHFAQLPIVVVSTRDRPEDRLKGLKSGADAYLTKQSLDAGELVDLVRRLGGR